MSRLSYISSQNAFGRAVSQTGNTCEGFVVKSFDNTQHGHLLSYIFTTMETTTPTANATRTAPAEPLAQILADAMRRSGTLSRPDGRVNVPQTALEIVRATAAFAATITPIPYGHIAALLQVLNHYSLNAAAEGNEHTAASATQALAELLELYNAALIAHKELLCFFNAIDTYEQLLDGPFPTA